MKYLLFIIPFFLAYYVNSVNYCERYDRGGIVKYVNDEKREERQAIYNRRLRDYALRTNLCTNRNYRRVFNFEPVVPVFEDGGFGMGGI